MEDCVRWNTNNVNQCVGVFWDYGQYGPLGVEGGSECFYTWDMVNGNSSASGTDSARLQTAALPTVSPCERVLMVDYEDDCAGTSD